MDKLMSHRFPAWILAALILILFVVQAVAAYRHLYFFIWWLDIPMHLFGGAWVALFCLSSYYASSRIVEKEHSEIFVIVFAVALTFSVGLLWEVYEFGVDHAVGDSSLSLADTLKDLVDDLAGALLAAWVFIHFGYNRKQ